MRQSDEIFAGTKRENTWHFFHDALKQMTVSKTQEWMALQLLRGRSYLDLWLLPIKGLYANEPMYKGRPPGNSPELNAWDASLNMDLKNSHTRHVCYTQVLPASDPNKFSSASPAVLTRGMVRLLDPDLGPDAGVPSSTRIQQDVGKWIDALVAIARARGTVVHGLGTRTGHRGDRAGPARGQWGGHRTKGAPGAMPWMHPAATQAFSALLAAAEARHTGTDISAVMSRLLEQQVEVAVVLRDCDELKVAVAEGMPSAAVDVAVPDADADAAEAVPQVWGKEGGDRG